MREIHWERGCTSTTTPHSQKHSYNVTTWSNTFVLSTMHGAKAFKDFIDKKNTRVPEFLEVVAN